MRESSVTRPSASGTLKSTRTKTRCPEASMSRTVSLSMVCVFLREPCGSGAPRLRSGRRGCGQTLGDELREVGDAAAVAPLVVVPGDDLDEVAAEDHVRGQVHDRGAGIAAEVGGHERLVGRAEDALERPGRGVPEGLVELLE